MVLPSNFSHNLTQNAFTLFPNPAQDNIIVDLPNPRQAQIEIYNIAGERVYAAPYSRSVDISSLSQGVYFLKVVQDESTAVERFEVVR
ncbi:MAG: T9SS type A sorting domain-containing protein [Flavobacteriales bacterium]